MPESKIAGELRKERALERLRQLARDQDGILLSKVYTSVHLKLSWKCNKCMTVWEASAASVSSSKSWCPVCGRKKAALSKRKVTLEILQEYAKNKGGELIKCGNAFHNAVFKCPVHGEWSVKNPAYVVSAGSWCKKCSMATACSVGIKENLKVLKQELNRRGWKLNSEITKGVKQKDYVSVTCNNGHTREMRAGSIFKDKRNCRICVDDENGRSRQKYNMDEVRKIVKSKHGKLLSKGRGKIKISSRIEIQCNVCDYIWATSISKIIYVSYRWCPNCGGSNPIELSEVKEIVADFNGTLVSKSFKNARQKLELRCAYNHNFYKNATTLRAGEWCPQCGGFLVGERLVRVILEELTGCDFPAISPDWLRRPSGQRLYFDGYCDELELAFEHHGRQHYEIDGKWAKNKTQLKEIQLRDRQKIKISKKYGVSILEVPQYGYYIRTIGELQGFIINGLEALDYIIPRSRKNRKISVARAFQPLSHRQSLQFNKFYDTVFSHGGKLLELDFKGTKEKYAVECENGHQFDADIYGINNGSWCPNCVGKNRTIDDLIKAARNFGGECLSTKYVNAISKYSWRCSEGHEFPARWSTVKRGSWCPICAKVSRSNSRAKYFWTDLISQLEHLGFSELSSDKKTGKLNSDVVSDNEKISFLCPAGHQINCSRTYGIATKIRKKLEACPNCNRIAVNRKKQTPISWFKKKLKQQGFKLISNQYKNSQSKMKIECISGHTTEKTIAQIRYKEVNCVECLLISDSRVSRLIMANRNPTR
jgi:hypothetical protein